MSNEEYADGGQDGEDEVGPVELLVEHGGREEVAKHDDVDDAGDEVHEDLEPEQVVDLVGKGRQVRVDAAEDVQLKLMRFLDTV